MVLYIIRCYTCISVYILVVYCYYNACCQSQTQTNQHKPSIPRPDAYTLTSKKSRSLPCVHCWALARLKFQCFRKVVFSGIHNMLACMIQCKFNLVRHGLTLPVKNTGLGDTAIRLSWHCRKTAVQSDCSVHVVVYTIAGANILAAHQHVFIKEHRLDWRSIYRSGRHLRQPWSLYEGCWYLPDCWQDPYYPNWRPL